MSKLALTLISLATSAALIGCASGDDRGEAAGRAIVDVAAATVAYAAMENCEQTIPATAREACLSRMRASPTTNGPAKPSNAKFDDLETYKTKREAELEKSE